MKYVLIFIAVISLLVFAYLTSNSSPAEVITIITSPSPHQEVTTNQNSDDGEFATKTSTNANDNNANLVNPSSSSSSTRGIIALYLTHVGFHGVDLVRANIHGWIQNLILPQKNLDLMLFYDTTNVTEEVLVKRIGLTQVPNLEQSITEIREKYIKTKTQKEEFVSTSSSVLETAIMNHNIMKKLVVDSDDGKKLQPPLPLLTEFAASNQKWFTFCSPASSVTNCILLSLVGVEKKWPKYLQDTDRRNELLARKDWLRCGCPPYCPVRRNPPEYVQGTRWYTYDIFFEANGWIRKYYEYWVKLDVDIGIFRPIKSVNLLHEMKSKNKIFLHTGYTYNGGGCSNNLHKSIVSWCKEKDITPVSLDEKWWKQDDNVYYSNFVISSVKFHTSPQPLELARYLNDDVEEGFFKYRWTDQSLFHKVFGVFVGPKEDDFLLDYSWMRWQKKRFKPNAVFYHSKKGKSRSELGKFTKL